MVERNYHIIDQKKKSKKKKMCEGRTETDCTTKGISVQKIMPAPFLHMLACLLAVGNNDLFLFSLSDMKAEAKAKAK